MLKLRNPFVLPPIKTGYSDGNGKVTKRHLRFYRRRSNHIGAIIPEPFYFDSRLRELPTQMGLDSDDKVPGVTGLVEAIHAGGAAAIAHLNHPGRMANPKIPGNVHVSATDRPCEAGGATPRRLEANELPGIVELFVAAARRAQAAGFDALEVQLGHGYLLAQFLSPLVNDREDEYGGDFAGRSRFPLMVVEALRAAVPLPLIVRVSGAEMVDGGITLPETVALARELATRGVEAIHVSAGTVCSTPPWFFQHMFVPVGKTWEMAEAIRDQAGMKVIAVGRVDDVEVARKLRERFPNDYIAVGRALVADPDFVGKVLGTEKGPVRPCLACAEGCLGGVKSGRGLQCLVNPQVGREEQDVGTADRPRRIAVVGGGLAGMEAAITLSDRGHTVDLFEPAILGGQFNLAPLTPHKRSMGRLVPYLRQELERRPVTVLSQRAKAADLTTYDGVVVATGSRPSIPPIQGLAEYRWADLLADDELPRDQHVLIIGGGLIGVDIATALIPRGNRVTLVKRSVDFGEDMEMIAKKLSLKMLKAGGTRFSDHTHIERIEGSTAYGTRNGDPVTFENIDLVVVAAGVHSVAELADELEGAVPFWLVGDARQVGNAQDAIADAFLTARTI